MQQGNTLIPRYRIDAELSISSETNASGYIRPNHYLYQCSRIQGCGELVRTSGQMDPIEAIMGVLCGSHELSVRTNEDNVCIGSGVIVHHNATIAAVDS